VIKNNDAKALKQSSELTESQAQKKSSIDEDSKNQKIIANEKNRIVCHILVKALAFYLIVWEH